MLQMKGNDDEEDEEEDDDKIVCCDELKYSVTRLVKGLASSRKGARQGFAMVLTEILSEFDCLFPEEVLTLIAKNLEVTGSAKAWVRHFSWMCNVQYMYMKAFLYDTALHIQCMQCVYGLWTFRIH